MHKYSLRAAAKGEPASTAEHSRAEQSKERESNKKGTSKRLRTVIRARPQQLQAIQVDEVRDGRGVGDERHHLGGRRSALVVTPQIDHGQHASLVANPQRLAVRGSASEKYKT